VFSFRVVSGSGVLLPFARGAMALTQADVDALGGRDLRATVGAVIFCVAAGFCWLLSRVTPIPLPDLLFVQAVSSCAVFEIVRSKESGLPPVGGGSVNPNPVFFRDFARQRHGLLCLLTQEDKRVQAMALGVGGLVMLLWRMFGMRNVEMSGLGKGSQHIQGWIFTLVASKVALFITRRLMVAAVRLSRGAAWLSSRAVVLLYCGTVTGLILCSEQGERLHVLWRWLVQWLFAISVVELAWCYIRWQLWRRLVNLLPSQGSGKWK